MSLAIKYQFRFTTNAKIERKLMSLAPGKKKYNPNGIKYRNKLYAKEKEEIENCIAVKIKQNTFGNIYSCIILIFFEQKIF